MHLQVNLAPETLPSAIESLPARLQALHEAISVAVSPLFPTQPQTQENNQHTGGGELWYLGPVA